MTGRRRMKKLCHPAGSCRRLQARHLRGDDAVDVAVTEQACQSGERAARGQTSAKPWMRGPP